MPLLKPIATEPSTARGPAGDWLTPATAQLVSNGPAMPGCLLLVVVLIAGTSINSPGAPEKPHRDQTLDTAKPAAAG